MQLSNEMPSRFSTGNNQTQTAESAQKANAPAYLEIRDLIYRTAGIYYTADKLYLMADRCQRRMKLLGVPGPEEYLPRLNQGHSSDVEIRALLNEITVGETYMFRNSFQLSALRDVIIPQIKADANRTKTKHVRIWSAGCSTGEEPYTLAMVLMELSKSLLQGWTFEVMATDLNENSLEVARSGVYGEYSLRNVTQLLRSKYFTHYDQSRLQVTKELKSIVQFSRLNLNDVASMQVIKPVDVIFCCNVLIYFDIGSKSRVIQGFYSRLSQEGYLFLGHAESLFQVNSPFHLIHFPQATAYRKVPGSINIGGL